MMKSRSIFIRLAVSLSLLSGIACSSGAPGSTRHEVPQGNSWRATDLLNGPAAIVKGVAAVPLCPLRLASETINNGTSMSGGHAALEYTLLPFKAIIDGVATGVGYVAGGAIDTVTGGAVGVVESAEGEEAPSSNVHCIMAGTNAD